VVVLSLMRSVGALVVLSVRLEHARAADVRHAMHSPDAEEALSRPVSVQRELSLFRRVCG